MPLRKHSSLPANIFRLHYQGVFHLVVGYTFNKQGIGYQGKLPWHIPEDLAYFKNITTQKNNDNGNSNLNCNNGNNNFNIVIMGRKTWDSIPDKFKPLKNRFNIILSNDNEYIANQQEKYKGVYELSEDNYDTGIYFTSWDKLFKDGSEWLSIQTQLIQNYKKFNQSANNFANDFNYFIIGGEQIYNLAINSGNPLIIHATEIYSTNKTEIQCDTYFPKIDNIIINTVSVFYKSRNKYEGNDLWYRFITYSAKTKTEFAKLIFPRMPIYNHPEKQYLDLMKNILEEGKLNNDRTGVGTRSIFGAMLKYDLRDTFPITTTKKLALRMVFEELMLYLSGRTDNAILQEKGINIWDGNTSREFLDKRGLKHLPTGDFGETYGFNMRHYGAQYIDCKTDYPTEGYGFDQLANVINLIKNEPYSRRIIIDLWNPATQHNASLPSCLCKYQFNVDVDRKLLNLAIYLRSSDYFLANNWNTCTGAMLVHMLCNLEGIELTPGELTVFIADAHIYNSHIEQVKINLEREPHPYPKLVFNGSGKKNNILEFKWEDWELLGYKSHPAIRAGMAI